MSKELAASGQLSAEDIERIRSVLTGNRIQAYKAGEQGVADVMTRIIDFQFNTLCDMALRSLTAPTNTPNGDRQELIDKCLDAGRDEGIEAAAKILHEPWASAVRALAQDQRSEAVSNAERVDINQGTSVRPTDKQSSDHPTDRYETLGYALAMRIMQSGMYDRLDDKERAECDELIRIGMAAPSREDCKPKEQK